MTKKETWSIFPQYVNSWKNKRDATKINRGINSNQNKFMNNTPTTVKFDIATIVPNTLVYTSMVAKIKQLAI